MKKEDSVSVCVSEIKSNDGKKEEIVIGRKWKMKQESDQAKKGKTSEKTQQTGIKKKFIAKPKEKTPEKIIKKEDSEDSDIDQEMLLFYAKKR